MKKFLFLSLILFSTLLIGKNSFAYSDLTYTALYQNNTSTIENYYKLTTSTANYYYKTNNFLWNDYSSGFGTGFMNFDGSNDYAISQAVYNIPTNDPTFTYSFWIRPHSTPASTKGLISNFRTSGVNAFQLFWMATNQIYLSIFASGCATNSTYIDQVLTVNDWNLITITEDSSQIVKVYINGELKYTSAPQGSCDYFQYGKMVMGAIASNSTQTTFGDYFDGEVGDLSTWNNTLSANQVLSIYESAETTCTSWTYSEWGACEAFIQHRTVLTSSPTGCSGGVPNLLQVCSGGDFTADFIATDNPIALSSTTGATIFTNSPIGTEIFGHCTVENSSIVYSYGSTWQGISTSTAWYQPLYTHTDAIAQCEYSPLDGHETELIYRINFPATWGTSHVCLAEINGWRNVCGWPDQDCPYGAVVASTTFDFVGSGNPCVDFTLIASPTSTSPFSTASSTNIWGFDNHEICTAEEWASDNIFQKLFCNMWYKTLNFLTWPINWASNLMSDFKNRLMGTFPFSIIETIQDSFSSSTAIITSMFKVKTAYATSSPAFNTSTGVFNGNFTLEAKIGNATSTFSFLSKANIVNVAGENTFDAIYIILRIFIWALFIAYCYDLVVHRFHEIGGNH